MPSLKDRLQHAWNAFTGNDTRVQYKDIGGGYGIRPDRPRLSRGNERSIITAIYNRIALDVSAIKIQHVRLDSNGGLLEVIDSGLNRALTVEANIDQTGRELIQDIVLSMFDEGVVAVVPVDTTLNPKLTGSYDIETMRTGKIIEWYPEHVRVRLYNEKTGRREEIVLPKKMVAIIQNPFYTVMNEPNSTLQRLIRKLSLLDAVDEQSSASKLDLIVQLPYTIKSEARKQQAEERRKDIEMQLAGSKYGIAYIDSTERVTQLNRSLENNLLKQIEYLTTILYSQLGITEEIIKGTADEKTMLNYYNNTIEPCLSAITQNMKRKFLTKTARTQNQSITYFRDPFSLVPVNQIADIADKFTRNEILSSNELRAIVGYKPVADDRANELRNKNLNQSPDAPPPVSTDEDGMEDEYYEDEYPEEEIAQAMSDFLEHHGIKGQRWGIHNGPPYPLDSKTSSAIKKEGQEKLRVNAKEYKEREKKSKDSDKSGLSKLVNSHDRSWKEVTVAGDLGGPLNFAEWPEDKREAHRSSKFAKDFDPVWEAALPGRHGHSGRWIDYQDELQWNGTRSNARTNNINPAYGAPGTTNNCTKCSAALALRAMGYEDVEAGRSSSGALSSAHQYWFDGAVPYKEKGSSNIAKRLESFGDGAFGSIDIRYPNGAGGHSIFFKKDDKEGLVSIVDGQCGRYVRGVESSKTKSFYERNLQQGSVKPVFTLEQAIDKLQEMYGFDADAFTTITRLDTSTPNWEHMAEDSVVRIEYKDSSMNKVQNRESGRLVDTW